MKKRTDDVKSSVQAVEKGHNRTKGLKNTLIVGVGALDDPRA